MSYSETIFCTATNSETQYMVQYRAAVLLMKILLQFYKIYSNTFLHNDVRLDQALNKHIIASQGHYTVCSRSVMMRWRKTAEHKAAVYNLKY